MKEKSNKKKKTPQPLPIHMRVESQNQLFWFCACKKQGATCSKKMKAWHWWFLKDVTCLTSNFLCCLRWYSIMFCLKTTEGLIVIFYKMYHCFPAFHPFIKLMVKILFPLSVILSQSILFTIVLILRSVKNSFYQ